MMKKTILTALGCLILASVFPATAYAQELIVGGQAVGIRIQTEGVLVSGVAQVETEDGGFSPAAEAGLKEGDCILRVDGKEVRSAAELIGAVGSAGGDPVELTVRRGERLWKFFVQPVRSEEGQWMMGMWLRDAVTGIGTVTFCDPDSGTYGALGHSITDEVSGKTVPLETGSITEAEIHSITPGTAGTPGALNGDFVGGQVMGSVELNSDCGIYGVISGTLDGRMAEVGEFRTGPATILATVNGREVREFSVRITRIYRDGEGEHVMLSVTDEELRAMTGGIVQGMSGSPILQDGRLVGAVTHVFVNDPTRGYGISIQDMLAAAGIAESQAA